MLTIFIEFALAMTLKEQILQMPAPSCKFFPSEIFLNIFHQLTERILVQLCTMLFPLW